MSKLVDEVKAALKQAGLPIYVEGVPGAEYGPSPEMATQYGFKVDEYGGDPWRVTVVDYRKPEAKRK